MEIKDASKPNILDASFSEPVSRDIKSPLEIVSRRRRWASLLGERPSELANMDIWLSQVITVSDMATPWHATESTLSDGTTSTRSSITQQSRWGSLLTERPANNDGGAITAWLVKVMRVSCAETYRLEREAARGKGAASTLSASSSSSVASNQNIRAEAKKSFDGDDVPSEVSYSLHQLEPACSGDKVKGVSEETQKREERYSNEG